MKKLLVVLILVAVLAVAVSFSVLSDQLAVAVPQSKIHFTKTATSSVDPATGRDQFVLVLAPNRGSLYTGTLTYVSSQEIQAVVLHDLTKEDMKGQPTWSVDGNTTYGISLMEPARAANSLQFTGAAVGFRSSEPFTVTVSVDGWIRGQPTEVIMQTLEIKEQSFVLPQSRAKVTIPMYVGIFNKEPVYYILTDSSNQTVAARASENQGSEVRFTPKLRWAPTASYDVVYAFTNGVKGDGMYGFQGEVFASSPTQPGYSPLRALSLVSWKTGQNPQVLDSVQDIQRAQNTGRIEITDTGAVINAPQIVWPGGQLQVRNVTQINNDTPFEGGQVTSIDKESKKVTFIAHRAWGADGRAIYHIITDATPAGPAGLIGVPTVSKLEDTLKADIFADMYQFKNGIKGSGPLGFQQSVVGVRDDQGYVPLCRVSIVEWKDVKTASVLETVHDINNRKSDGTIHITLARPLSSDYVMNCPLVSLSR